MAVGQRLSRDYQGAFSLTHDSSARKPRSLATLGMTSVFGGWSEIAELIS